MDDGGRRPNGSVVPWFRTVDRVVGLSRFGGSVAGRLVARLQAAWRSTGWGHPRGLPSRRPPFGLSRGPAGGGAFDRPLTVALWPPPAGPRDRTVSGRRDGTPSHTCALARSPRRWSRRRVRNGTKPKMMRPTRGTAGRGRPPTQPHQSVQFFAPTIDQPLTARPIKLRRANGCSPRMEACPKRLPPCTASSPMRPQ